MLSKDAGKAFAFIPFEGPGDPLKKTKQRHVRAHVSKRFHQLRRAAQEEFGTACPVDPRGQDEQDEAPLVPDAPVLSLEPYKFRHQPLIVQHIHRIEGFFTHYLPSGTEPSPISTHLLPASLVSPAVFHALSYVSTVKFEGATLQSCPTEAWVRKGRAIRAINDGLSDARVRESDDLVAAIVCLANVECLSEEWTAVAQHVKGLHELCRVRGGVRQLGMRGMLAKFIYLHSWFFEFLRPQVPGNVLPVWHATCLQPLSMFQLFTLRSDDDEATQLCEPYVDCLADMHGQLTGSCPPGRRHEEAGTGAVRGIRASCRAAGRVWANLRMDKGGGQDRRALGIALRECLEGTSLQSLWHPIPGALVWCLLVGAHNSHGDAVAWHWFASKLLTGCVTAGLVYWEGLRRSLTWFGFHLKG